MNIAHEFQLANNQTNQFNYKFDHCLVKASEDSIDVTDIAHYNALIFNKDPEFANDSDRYHLDYSLDTLSPAKDAGDPQLPVTFPFLDRRDCQMANRILVLLKEKKNKSYRS